MPRKTTKNDTGTIYIYIYIEDECGRKEVTAFAVAASTIGKSRNFGGNKQNVEERNICIRSGGRRFRAGAILHGPINGCGYIVNVQTFRVRGTELTVGSRTPFRENVAD